MRRAAVSLALGASAALLGAMLAAGATVACADAAHQARFSAAASPSPVRAGEVATVRVDAVIASGWHLYSLFPTPPPGPTPTSLSVEGDGVSAAGPATEDAPVTQQDPNFGKPVAFHEKSARFALPVRIDSSRSPGTIAATVIIGYQTCNATVCLPPMSARLPVQMSIAAGPPRPQYAAPPLSRIKAPNTPEGSLIGFALAAFGAGLLALLTPCVFPLIPVTFGFFTKQVGGEHRRLIGLAGAYAIGIIVSFTLLGLIAALSFGAAGANRVAANPWFNLFFGILFVVFAFSFFESFLIQLPPALSRFARPASGASGLTGVLLMGLAFVFAAFTCTAPFIGTVLVAAASASGAAAWARPLLGMVVFSLALALPFFLLALFPGLLTRLPRSGGWLTTFKATLGFVELAYALTYFSKADLVWQAHLLTKPVIFALWAVIASAAALYLLGLLRVSAFPDASAKPTPLRIAWTLVFGAIALYCLYALTGRPVNGLVLAYLPPDGYGLTSAGAGAADTGADAGWLSSYADALAQAKASGKPVFIDFTGYTCTNCRYVEQNIFTKEPVKGLLANRFTRLRLYTDGGPDGAANQAFQQKMFGTVALPLYAVVAADGRIAGQLSGSNNDVAHFAAFLTRGAREASATAPAPAPDSAAWRAYSPEALAQASALRKPVIIDFTAAWCTNCHALERTVFTAPPVAANLGSFVTLRADLTDFNSVPSAALEKKYGILQLPAVLFLSPDGREIAGTRVTGLVAASEFAGRMSRTQSAVGSPNAKPAATASNL